MWGLYHVAPLSRPSAAFRSIPVVYVTVNAHETGSLYNCQVEISSAHKPCSAQDNNIDDHAILRALSLLLLGRKASRLANPASRCTMLQGVVSEYDSRERPRLSR